MATGTVIYTAVWQGFGNARLPFYATSIGMWCIRIGTAYLMGIVLGWGLPGIWAGTLLDNGFLVISTLPLPALYEFERIGNAKNSLYLGFRWNLLDSYEAILSGIEETFAQFSIPYDKEKVREFILRYSVQDLLEKVAEEKSGCGSAQSGACPESG